MSIAEGRTALPALAATLALCAAAAPAAASPFEEPTQGGAVFTGPTHADPSAIAINPAALGLFAPGGHLHIIGRARADQIRIARRTLDVETGETSPGPTLDDLTYGLGWTIAGSYNLQRVFLSASVDMPSPEVYPGGEEVAYHSLGGRWQRRSLFSAAASWRVLAPLWIGIGLRLFSKQELELEFRRDTALEAGRDPARGIASDCEGVVCGVENPAAAETYNLRVDTPWLSTRGVGLSVGLVAAMREWYLAVSYERPFSREATEAEGTVTMTEAPRDGGEEHTGFAEVGFEQPQFVRIGARGPLTPGLELVTSARWTNLSPHRVHDVRMFGVDLPAEVPAWYPRYRGFDDAYMIEAGVEQRDSGERLRLGGRIAFETGTVDADEVSPMQIAGAHVDLAAGVQIRIGQRIALQLGYQFGWYPTMDADPGVFDPIGRLDCVDAAYDIDACTAVREGRGLPSAAGEYSRFSHAARVAIRLESL